MSNLQVTKEMTETIPCQSDTQWIRNLALSSIKENSMTLQRGFVGRAPYNNANTGETPPPLHHWTRNPLPRIFPQCDILA